MPDSLLEHRITQAEARVAQLEKAVGDTRDAVVQIKAWIIAGGAIMGTLAPLVSVVITKLWN